MDAAKSADGTRSSIPNDAMTSVAAVIAEKEGLCWKKGGGSGILGRRNWTERYFVYNQGTLTYFHTVNDYKNNKVPLKDSVYRLKHCDVRSDNQFWTAGHPREQQLTGRIFEQTPPFLFAK